MKNWKVTILYQGTESDVTLQAPYYSDAFVGAELKYPGCQVKCIVEIRNNTETQI
jgi:hypothetical protein